MMRRAIFFVMAAVLLAGSAAYAHHSFAATYDTGKQVKLEGKLLQFVYRNPHSFVSIQAPDQNGVQQRWAIEWGGSGQLALAGVTRETLKVGDEVVILGHPSRVPGEYRAMMVNLKRPSDGFTWGSRSGEAVE